MRNKDVCIRVGCAVVRDLTTVKAAELAAFYIHNWMHLRASRPYTPIENITVDLWQEKLNQYAIERQTDKALRFALLMTTISGEQFIGAINFDQISRGPLQACYLGFCLGKEFEGQGFMSMILPRVINYVFETTRLNRIQATHRPDNLRSERLLEKLGFVREGIAKRYLKLDDQWHDAVLRSILNPTTI